MNHSPKLFVGHTPGAIHQLVPEPEQIMNIIEAVNDSTSAHFPTISDLSCHKEISVGILKTGHLVEVRKIPREK